jgi:hypothetical protein
MRNRHIVVLDWIEDCLLGKGLKKRLLAEIGYSLDRTIQRLKKGKTDHAQFRAKFEEGIRISKELCDNSKASALVYVQELLTNH